MEFFRRAAGSPARLGILAAAFHPPTRAHLALARAALERVDEVLFVLPRVFPHKMYERAGLEARLELVLEATRECARCSVGVSEGGLFIEIAREARVHYAPATEFWFLCGRDAAERIAGWDYGRPGAFAAMLDEFGLLVADRGGPYEPPPELRHRVERLPLPEDVSGISATQVRRRVAAGEPWEHLVPERITELVRQMYY